MNIIGNKLSYMLERPFRVIIFCFCLLMIGLVFDGSLWRLYHIHQNKKLLEARISEENNKIDMIRLQLAQLKNPAFIEKQARERLEFLEKGDLLFVFSED